MGDIKHHDGLTQVDPLAAIRAIIEDLIACSDDIDGNQEDADAYGVELLEHFDAQVEQIAALTRKNETLRNAWETSEKDRLAALTAQLEEKKQEEADAAEMLWVVLANVSGGDWTKQNRDWQEAAARWCDNYFKTFLEGRSPDGDGQRETVEPQATAVAPKRAKPSVDVPAGSEPADSLPLEARCQALAKDCRERVSIAEVRCQALAQQLAQARRGPAGDDQYADTTTS